MIRSRRGTIPELVSIAGVSQAHPGRADGLICVNPRLSFIGSCQWRNPRVTTRSVVSGS